ncbi:unnamed protein product [Acanthoscelides obtectus]|uniref:Transposase n=1 Tax=Acanthoscelides obtectus TaxID=200917 RepID=A0A9P0P1C7_ACAOB|nr:unnamed protein product [Acanthoscelides obtectus]CAK1629662.1 Transposable element Tc1 transposase [Acanthoscelides obtectus]
MGLSCKMQWCRQRSLWDQEWNSIVFGDESRFCLGMHDGRARVRRRRGERRNPQFFVEMLTCSSHRWSYLNWCSHYSEFLPPFLRKINLERRIILHQDNASSHTAQKTRQYLTEENVELLDHPPYSLDLNPNDLLLSRKLKLGGQRFQSPEEAVDVFKNAVLNLPANGCFENWLQMCINLRGEYFEKQ